MGKIMGALAVLAAGCSAQGEQHHLRLRPRQSALPQPRLKWRLLYRMFQEVCHEFQRSMLAAVNDTELFMHIFEGFLQSFESYNVSSRYAGQGLFELAGSVYFTYIGDTGDSVGDRLNGFMQSLNGMNREDAG